MGAGRAVADRYLVPVVMSVKCRPAGPSVMRMDGTLSRGMPLIPEPSFMTLAGKSSPSINPNFSLRVSSGNSSFARWSGESAVLHQGCVPQAAE